MCPDKKTLSAFVDGEIMSPWKEKIQEHIDSCVECSETVKKYQLMHSIMAEAPGLQDEVVAASQNRMFDRIKERTQKNPVRKKHFWERRFYIPLPAMAAAAVLVMAVTFIVPFMQINNTSPVMAPTASFSQADFADDEGDAAMAENVFAEEARSRSFTSETKDIEMDLIQEDMVAKMAELAEFEEVEKPGDEKFAQELAEIISLFEENHEHDEAIVIELPPQHKFDVIGDSSLLHAADFQGGGQ